MKILLPSVLPSVFPKSDQETAAQQHLRRQEKKEEKSCEKRAVLIREGQLKSLIWKRKISLARKLFPIAFRTMIFPSTYTAV